MSTRQERSNLDRRRFLTSTALPLAGVSLAETWAAAPRAGEADSPGVGMITRQKRPDNLEFPFARLESFLTPNHLFYVRTHFEVPAVDVKTWRLRVEGDVGKPIDLGYEELRKLPARTLTATLECSGNGRVFLDPPQVGLRWEQGGVSTAEWTGVSLNTILERARVKPGAIEVILQGADRGKLDPPDPKTPGIIPYARSMSLKKARQPEVLLAYRMNGKDLPARHGFPLRVVVPGWYGMASVKWLERIVVTSRPFHGFFQTFAYSVWQRQGGIPSLVPVTELEVKAQIARPALHEVIPAGSKYRVFGAAWTGEADVTRVEVSTDGGKRWSDARLLDRPIRYAWRFWEFDWATPKKPGRTILMARATDSKKRVQPMDRDRDRRDAMISQVQPIEVEVR